MGRENESENETRDRLSGAVLGAAIEVHRALGPGLLEAVYEECLCHELNIGGIQFARQVPLPIQYKGVYLDCGYRMDLVVEDQLILEVKSVERLLPLHDAQLLTYLKLSGIKKGLLLNFNARVLKQGVRRLVL